MLEQHDGHVLLRQANLLEGAHEKDMRIGTTRRGDALARQVGHRLDGAVCTRHKCRSFWSAIDADGIVGIAVDPADQRGCVSRRAEIKRAGIEKLERLVGAKRLHPPDGDAIRLELLLEEPLLL